MAHFPTVGVIGAGPLTRLLISPAISLGINLKIFAKSLAESAAQASDVFVGDYLNLSDLLTFARSCDLITIADDQIPLSVINNLERAGVLVRPGSAIFNNSALAIGDIPVNKFGIKNEVYVMVARSPHGQVATWSTFEITRIANGEYEAIAPAQSISETETIAAQKIAIEKAAEVGLIGVMVIKLVTTDEKLVIGEIQVRLTELGNWSIEGSVTSQFEQYLRAILDLPLGDTAMRAPFAVSRPMLVDEKSDMYRPYLHLMARNPKLKITQYRNAVGLGNKVGHVSLIGDNLKFAREEVKHAVDYINGVID